MYDSEGKFASRCNTSMVSLERVLSPAEQGATDPAMWHKGQTDDAILRKLIEDHHKWTGSLQARHLLDQWEASRAKFVKVFPNEYKRALSELAAKEARARSVNTEADASATVVTSKVKASDKKTKASPSSK